SCLIEIGLPCSDEKKFLRPDEKITFSEWEKAFDDLGKLLGFENLSDLCIERISSHKYLSFAELNNSITMLRKKFSMNQPDRNSIDGNNRWPTRLEALSQLSSLISEFY
ncbi:MAG: hypothetical protein ACOYXC_09005, partial [Candidatus Rifleibacteriota bacterium]